MQTDLDIIRRIVRERVPPSLADVYLFGSRAWGTPARYSDVDVAVAPKRPLPQDLLPCLREALEESDTLLNVDVVDLAEADPGLRERIQREGIRWND